MKKIMSFCCLVLMIAMVGCGSNNTTNTSSASTSTQSSTGTIFSTPKRAARQDILSLSKDEVRKQNTAKKLQQFGKDNGGITPISLKIEEGKAGNFSIDEMYDYMSKEINVINIYKDNKITFSIDKSDNSIRFNGIASNNIAGEIRQIDFTLTESDYIFIDDFILSSTGEDEKGDTRGIHMYVFCDKQWQKMSEETANAMRTTSEWRNVKNKFINNDCVTLHFIGIPIITDDEIIDNAEVIELWNKNSKFTSYINRPEGYNENKRFSKGNEAISYNSKVICYSEIIVTNAETTEGYFLSQMQNDHKVIFSLPTK